MPLFSIIIPTYNSELFLHSAIDSVLKQTYSDFEILIIDGASLDNTLNVANSFNDNRIKIYSEKDKGIYDAMNKGIQKSNGEWLYFLGSDDKLYDTEVLADVKSNIKSTNSFIYGNVKIISDTNWAKKGELYDGKFDMKKLFKKNISHQAIFYNRNTFVKFGVFNIDYKICADFDYNLKIFSNSTPQYINRTIAYFSGGGISTTGVDEAFSNDFASNIIHYHKNIIYLSLFSTFEVQILKQAKKHLIKKKH